MMNQFVNDRIRELAEQAGLKYHNWITNESNIKDGDFKYPRLEDLEKFAECIIQECGEIADRYADENLRLLPSEEMKKKFGL
jgi:signal recognition particle subunit SEC65